MFSSVCCRIYDFDLAIEYLQTHHPAIRPRESQRRCRAAEVDTQVDRRIDDQCQRVDATDAIARPVSRPRGRHAARNARETRSDSTVTSSCRRLDRPWAAGRAPTASPASCRPLFAARVGLDDPPPPVRMNDAERRAVVQTREGRGPRRVPAPGLKGARSREWGSSGESAARPEPAGRGAGTRGRICQSTPRCAVRQSRYGGLSRPQWHGRLGTLCGFS